MKSFNTLFLLVAIIITLLSHLCFSAQIVSIYLFLNPGAQNYAWPCGDEANPCPDINTALLAYSTMEVGSQTQAILNLGGYTFKGINNTNLNLFNRSISVTGGPNGAMATIDMSNNGNFFTISEPVDGAVSNTSTTNLTLSQLNLINGDESEGYGAVININTTVSNTNLILYNVVATSNVAEYGAVISITTNQENTFLSISNSLFKQNTASHGTVIYSNSPGSISISNSVFTQNTVLSDGILYMMITALSLSNVSITSNTGNSSILKIGYNANVMDFIQLQVTDNQVLSTFDHTCIIKSVVNTVRLVNSVVARNRGGTAINFFSPGMMTLNGTTVDSNSGGGNGGAIYVNTGTLSFINAAITNNSALYNGGGIYFNQSMAGIFYSSTISNNKIVSNTGTGSAIYIESITVKLSMDGITLNSNQFTNNTQPIYCTSGNVQMNDIVTDTPNGLYYCGNATQPCNFYGSFPTQSCTNHVIPSPTPSHTPKGGNNNNEYKKQIIGIAVGVPLGVGVLVIVIAIIYKRHYNRNKYIQYN